MNIAMLTTWNSACGIAEYSANLVKEFLRMPEKNNVLLLTNKPHTNLETHARIRVAPVFGVHWWGEDPIFHCDKAQSAWRQFEDKFGGIDAFFVQYQSSLYHPFGFNAFMAWANSCPRILIQHDSSYNFDHKVIYDSVITHNLSIDHTHYIPMPIIERYPKVFSFGMGGRNDYELIGKTCKKLGIAFDWHDSRLDGWVSEGKLFGKMQDSDAIVLWYNEVPIEGQSSALRTAIASHRPVIVNDVGWFKDAPWFVTKVKTEEELFNVLEHYTLHLDYIQENSYRKCAERYLEIASETNVN